MSIPLVINGQVFEYPQNFDESWGDAATGWAQAVTAGALYLSGGSFPLMSQVDFGASFGLKVKSLLTETANPSLTGYLMLAKSDLIGWRNNANSADLTLGINGSDQLTFNGSAIGITSLTNTFIYVGNASNQPIGVALSGDATISNTGVLTIANNAITNAKVSTTAAIAVSKLGALTVSQAVATDSSGILTPSTTTAVELGYVHGVTGPIQTQLAGFLPLTGGTMSGPIAMGSNKITALTRGSNTGEATTWDQINSFLVYSVALSGATGNGTTDDTAAIQAAVNATPQGGICFFPAGTYKLTAAISLPTNISLRGTFVLSQTGGTVLSQTGSTPIFNLHNSSQTGAEIQNILIDGIHFVGGTNQLFAENGGVWVTIRNCEFDSYSNAGILNRGFIQQWFLRDCYFTGGNYGIYHHDTGLQANHSTLGTPLLWDKCNYYSLDFNGHAINAIYIVLPSGTGNQNSFHDLTMTFCMQDGAVFGGGLRGINFQTVTTESIGFINATPTPPTTGSITATQTNLVVASASGLAIGQTLTIAGAGTGGIDLYPVVSSIAGTTINLSIPAQTSVTSAEVVNYLYSDLRFIDTGGGRNPTAVTITNASFGFPGGLAATRYALDGTGMNFNNILINPDNSRPVYNPNASIGGLIINTGNTNFRPSKTAFI